MGLDILLFILTLMGTAGIQYGTPICTADDARIVRQNLIWQESWIEADCLNYQENAK